MYWTSVVLYGVLLVVALLYLRFPAEKLRQFCSDMIERKYPGVSCSIGEVRLGFPPRVLLEDVRISEAGGNKALLYEDALLAVQPTWPNPLTSFAVNSRAYGGSHSLKLMLDKEAVGMEDIAIDALDLGKLSFLRRKLDRKITGLLAARGSATFTRKGLDITAAQGDVAVRDGSLELKKPLLELDSLELKEGALSLRLAGGRMQLTEGTVRSPRLKAAFAGDMVLADSLPAATLDMQGSMTPTPLLYQEKRQLKLIVSRMQRQAGGQDLSFKVGGTLGRPTFVFVQ